MPVCPCYWPECVCLCVYSYAISMVWGLGQVIITETPEKSNARICQIREHATDATASTYATKGHGAHGNKVSQLFVYSCSISSILSSLNISKVVSFLTIYYNRHVISLNIVTFSDFLMECKSLHQYLFKHMKIIKTVKMLNVYKVKICFSLTPPQKCVSYTHENLSSFE